MLLHTDGVTESRNAQREEYGVTRLAEVLCAARHKRAAEINQDILGAVRAWCKDPRDDITLVVARYHR